MTRAINFVPLRSPLSSPTLYAAHAYVGFTVPLMYIFAVCVLEFSVEEHRKHAVAEGILSETEYCET